MRAVRATATTCTRSPSGATNLSRRRLRVDGWPTSQPGRQGLDQRHARSEFQPEPHRRRFHRPHRAIVVTDTDVYVGGDSPRSAVSRASISEAQPDHRPGRRRAAGLRSGSRPDGLRSISVGELQVSGNDVYVAGDFTSIGGLSRSRIAKISATTGDADAQFDAKSSATHPARGRRHRARARHAVRRRGFLEHRGSSPQQRRRAEPQDRLRGDRLQPERDQVATRGLRHRGHDDEVYIGGGFDQVGGARR